MFRNRVPLFAAWLIAGCLLAGPAQAQRVPGLPELGPVVEANARAVVNITVTLDEAALRREFVPGALRRDIGSGFVISEDGLIVTNRHLVADAASVTVRLADRREFSARVLGVDEPTDLALLRIAARNLPTVRFGDSTVLRPGDWVIAIGSPYGLESTVTAGIVSGTSRAVAEGGYVGFIQTDAAVNPGSSGGPLLNLEGEVVGMNALIYSMSGGYQGVSFAIPSEVVRRIADELLATGRVERGRIGVGVQEMDQPLAEAFGLEAPQGALVTTVEAGGPAAIAGLAAGDIILAVNGRPIRRSADFPVAIAETKPGSRAVLSIWRKRARQELAVAVGRAAGPPVETVPPEPSLPAPFGLATRALTAVELRALELESGLMVERSSGAAARAGIVEGDIVASINGTPAIDPQQLLTRPPGAARAAALLILRGEQRQFVAVPLE